jgi:peptidoglycan/LPS O-acetylase OafA/YrhL
MSVIGKAQPEQLQSPAGTPVTARFYRPELDALRFFAFLMAYARHAVGKGRLAGAVAGGGGFGVSIFFVLSAFLLTELLLREREATGTIRIRKFLLRRILRIWPLYTLSIALGFAVGCLLPDKHIRVLALPYLLFFLGNLYAALHDWGLGAINPLWSISVEEQFYLVLPAMVRVGGRSMLPYFACAAIALAYLTLVVCALLRVAANPGIWVNSFVQFQFFALGIVLALLLHDRRWQPAVFTRLLLFGAAVTGFVATEECFHLQSTTPLTPVSSCCGYAAVLLSCAAIFLSIFNVAERLVPLPLRFLGRITFGLYTLHGLVLSLTAPLLPVGISHLRSSLVKLLLLVVTVALASLSYRFVEAPFLRWKGRLAVVPSGSAAPLRARPPSR